MLREIAKKENMSEQAYLAALSDRYWGGVSDLWMLAQAAQQHLRIVNKHGHQIAEHKPDGRRKRGVMTLMWHGDHYTVPAGTDVGPRRERRYRDHIRKIDQTIRQREQRQQRQSEMEEGIENDMLDKQPKHRGGNPAEIQRYNDQRAWIFQNQPDTIQRHGAHHRCVLCHQWATSIHLSSREHTANVAAWSALESPERQDYIRRHEQQEAYMLGTARGIPRLQRSRSPRRRQESSNAAPVYQVRVCLLCETVEAEGHDQTHEHVRNYQAWRDMTEAGQERYLQRARDRLRHGSARGGMKKEDKHQAENVDKDHQDMEPNTAQQAGEHHPGLHPQAGDPTTDEEPSDMELALALQASLTEEQDDGGGDLWVVLCTSATREYTIRCALDTTIGDIRVSIALAMKCQSTEIVLATEGLVPHSEMVLGALDPPYCFEIMRRTNLPQSSKGGKPSKRPKISVDLGRLEAASSTSLTGKGLVDEDRQSSSLSGLAASASGSAIGPPHQYTPMAERERGCSLRMRDIESIWSENAW